MSSNVDNRIVRMTFDNAKFEQGIKNTMDTLTKFEQKLKFSESAKGFEAINKAANKLNLSGLDKTVDDSNKKLNDLASNAKSNLEAMQKSLDKTDFSKLSDSAGKASDAINKALASINFDDLDEKSQETLKSMMDSAGNIDFSSITDAAGKVDFSALSSNAAVAIGAVMDLAGDVNFNGIAQNAELAMSDVNSAIDKVEFSSLGVEATEAIGEVNKAAASTDMSAINSAAWVAANDTNSALASIDMQSLVSETDEAAQGFKALEAVAVGALINIGGQLESFALGQLKGAFSNLTKPMMDGFQEYQTQMGSIQTILANTGRSFTDDADIAEVNGVLDELNTYADKTIYNFTEMVKNIGMFTAAGTDMYDSADAIKGMANLAALQGADSASASRAMYQTSQALSSGVVKLMDWRSLENAGMGGQIFRDVILNAAVKKGQTTGDNSLVELAQGIQSGELKFNDTLTENEWLTSDILLESLTQLTYAFGDLDDATKHLDDVERAKLEKDKKAAYEHLKTMGYTDQEIEAVFELGQKAQDSATKVRTLSQLTDSLQEAMGSGWVETWRLIIGDFKEATEVLTKLNEALTGVIGVWDDARNNLLQQWSNLGGHFVLFGGERSIYQRDEKGNVLLDEEGNPLYEDETMSYIGAFDYILEAIGKPLQALKDAFSDVFGDFFTGEALMDLTEGFRDFTEGLVLSDTAAEGLKGVLTLLFEVIKAGLQIGSHVISIVTDIIDVIRVVTDPIMDLAALLVGELAKGLGWILDKLLEGEGIVYEFAHGGLQTLWDVLSTIVDTFTSMIDLPGTIAVIEGALSGFFGALFNFEGLKDILEQASWWISEFFFQVLDFFGLMPEVDSPVSLPEYFKKIKEGAETNLKKALDVIIDAIPGMRDFVNVMAGDDQQKKIEFFTNIFKRIGDVVVPIISALTTPIVLLVGALRQLWDIFINSAPVQAFITWIDELKNSALAWLLSLPEKITTFATTISQAFDALTGKIEKSQISDEAKKMVDSIGQIDAATPFKLLGGGVALGLKTVVDIVKNVFGTLKEFLFGWLDDTPADFVKGLDTFISGIPKSLESPLSSIKEFAKSILPEDMSGQIDGWFYTTMSSLTMGVGELIKWVNEKTEGAKTVPEAIAAIVSGAWESLITSIQNFDPQEAINSLLTTLDTIKTGVFGAAGGFLDYIFGFSSKKVLDHETGEQMEVGFTFTGFLTNLSDNITKGIEEAKKTINSLFTQEDGTIFDKISKFFVGEDEQQTTLETKIGTLSDNLELSAYGMATSFTDTATNPSLTFDKISAFIDNHKFDILDPLEGIANWLDTTLFPNGDKIFTTGLNNIKRTIHTIITEIHKFLRPVFDGIEDWPSFFTGVLERVASAIGSGLGTIFATFTSDDFSFAKLFDDIGASVETFIQDLRVKFPVLGDILGGVALAIGPVVGTIAGLIAGLGDGSLSVVDFIIGLFTDLPGTLLTIAGGLTTALGGVWDAFLTALDEKVPGAKSTIQTVLTELDNMFNIFKTDANEDGGGLIETLKNFFIGLQDTNEEAENSGILTKISNFFSGLWDILDSDKFAQIAQGIQTIGITWLLANIGTFIGGVKSILKGIGDKIAGKEHQSVTEKIRDLAISIGIVAGAVYALGQLDDKQLKQAEKAMQGILEALGVMELVGLGASALASHFDLEEFSSAKEQAIEIGAMAAAVAVLGRMKPEEIKQATDTIMLLKVVMSGIDTLANAAIAGVLHLAGVSVFQPVQGTIKEIVAMALALLVLSFIPEEKLLPIIGTFAALEALLLGFQVLSGVLGAIVPPSDKVIESLGNAAIKLGAMALLMGIGIGLLSDMDVVKIALAEAGIAGIMLIFAKIVAYDAEHGTAKTYEVAKALVLVGAAVVEMCFGISLLKDMDWAVILTAAGGIDSIMGMFILVAKFTQAKEALDTAKALVLVGASVVEMCVGFKQLDGMDPDVIATAGFMIDTILGVFALVAKASSNVQSGGQLLATGGMLAIGSAGIVEICLGLKQLDGMAIEDIQWATVAIDTILLIIGGVAKVAGSIMNVGQLLATGGMFSIAAFGIIEICFGLKQLDGTDSLDIAWATGCIDTILLCIGAVSMMASNIAQVGPLLATGGMLAIASAGIVAMLLGFKQLDGMDWEVITAASAGVDSILLIMGAIAAFLSNPAFAAGGGVLLEIAGAVYLIAEAFKALAEGIRAWLELQADLPQLLDDARKGLEEVSEHADLYLSQLGQTVKQFWDEHIKPAIDQAIQNFTNWVTNDAWPAIQKFFGDIPKFASETWAKIKEWWTTTGGPAAAKFLQELPGKISTWWQNDALPVLGKIWEAISTWFTGTFMPGVGKFFGEDLPKWWTGTAWPTITNWFTKDLPEAAKKWWKDTAKPAIDNFFKKFGETIQKGWNGFWTSAGKILSDFGKEVVDKIMKIPEMLGKKFDEFKKAGAEIVNGILKGINDTIQSLPFIKTINDIGTTIFNGISEFFDINSPSKLMRDRIGKAIPEGIGVGMVKYAKLTQKPTIKMGRTTLNAITDYFDIHSPSRLMRDKVGRYIPEGIAAGLDAYAVIAVDSAESLGSSISQAVYSGLGDISGSQYGYGISPVIDIETLKTDIEVLHEMLRVKIDEVCEALHTKLDENLETFTNFILEQLQAKLEKDDEIFSTRFDTIKEYIQTDLKEYTDTKMEELNEYLGQVQEGLTQAIPEMTNQIIGQFETVNQSLSSILQAMTSDTKAKVDTAITETIVERLDEIGATLGTGTDVTSRYRSNSSSKGDSNSIVDLSNKPTSILDWLISIFDGENFYYTLFEPIQNAVRSVVGMDENFDPSGKRIYDHIRGIDIATWNEDETLAQMVHSMRDGLLEDNQTESMYSILSDGMSGLIGDGGTSDGRSIYDIVQSMEKSLYMDDVTIADIMQTSLAEQMNIHKYLEDILGSVEEGNGTLAEQLAAAITNGEKIDNNTDAVQEANEERERAELFTKNAIQNLQDSLNKQRYETNWNDAMGLGLTQETRQSLSNGDIAFSDGQKYVM